jgi:hypothetical protein
MDNTGKKHIEISELMKAVKRFILYALNPTAILKEEKRSSWYYHLILPAVGWMLFFLQVGIYKNSQSYYPFGRILLLSLTGLVIGYASVFAISCILSFMLTLWGLHIRADHAISCVSMSHTYMTFSVVLGLVYSIFGSISPSSFGIAGLLCTMLPIYAAIRSLGNKNAYMPPVLASVIGVLMLAGWQLILYINV